MIARRGVQLVTASVVLALVGAALLVLSERATGSNAQHCTRLAAQSLAREAIVTGHGRNVVVIGDSYAVGLGARSPATSWPSQLPGRVHVDGLSGSGFSAGASPCHGVSYAAREPHALRHGADLVVVEGGLNDYDQPAAAVRAGFRTLVRELAGHHVLIVGPVPAPARLAGARRVDALLRQESARARVDYLSMIGEQLPYLADHLHLTPSGHRDFGRVVARALGS